MAENTKNFDLSKALDTRKIEAVNQSIEKAHGLPNECYTSRKYLMIEREVIFKDKWTVIGVGSSVPNPGDAKPYNLLGIPLVILRDKDNIVRVFHNVCSHRGFKLLDKSCSLKNVLRCPYHSWSYDFKGKLIATPHIGGLNIHESEKFSKSKSNL
ncbi:Rieske (2Fe-2S) protein, partial [Candidatus Pelagibacter sp.]|nr:Rieske (2Fe-2S) protein [Candidatus Pelagibacter sp.]